MEYEIRDFFKDEFSSIEIKKLSDLASANEMFAWRSRSSIPYRDRRSSVSDEQLIELMANEPRLIRRPMLTDGSKIIFGFRAGAYDEMM